MALGAEVFEFFLPTVTLMGIGASAKTGEQVRILGGTRVLMVTDKGLMATGIGDQIRSQVEKAGAKVIVFDETEPNPTDKNVQAGLELFQESRCDMIISLGGGSPHDCAKGIGIVASNGGNIRNYEGINKAQKPMPPLIAINTTAGTGSEMTRYCIITDTDRKVKMTIVDWRVTPNVAVNDPLLMLGLPPSLTAATGMDALTHAIEAYVSTTTSPITDACALKAIKLISRNLSSAVANGKNLEARDKMAYAEYLAGMAFNNAGLGYVHAMAHQLGGFLNLPHGLCNAILLPYVEKLNLPSNVKRFADIAEAMGENICGLSVRDAAEKAIAAIRRLAEDIGMPTGLKAYGITEDDLEMMAKNAQKDSTSLTNPRIFSLEDIINIYKEVFDKTKKC